jgi:hypothetical protein
MPNSSKRSAAGIGNPEGRDSRRRFLTQEKPPQAFYFRPIEVSNLLPADSRRIAERNQRDADLPGDFADQATS